MSFCPNQSALGALIWAKGAFLSVSEYSVVYFYYPAAEGDPAYHVVIAVAAFAALFLIYLVPQAYACGYML